MTTSHLRRAYNVLIAAVLAIAYMTVATPPATAVSYGECNSGWAVMVEVRGGNGGGAYVPARSDGYSASRSCWLQYRANPTVRQEVRRLQYGLQDTGYSLYADGLFGPITQRYLVHLQTRHGLAPDGVYGPNTGSVMTWCYWYNSRKSCGRWI